MFKKMKKKTRVGMVVAMLAALAVAVILFLVNDETRDYLLTGDDINRISAGDVEDEKIVRGKLYAILGCYAEDDEGAYYVIPIGEEEYMGLYLNKKQEDRAWKMIEETVDYINGDREEMSADRISTRGMIYRMDATERQYFHEWFTDTGFMTEADASRYAVDYTYAVIPFGEWNNDRDIVFYIFIALSLIVALVPLFWLITGRDISGVKKTIAQNGWNQEEIEADILSGLEKKSIIMGRKYILSRSGWRWELNRIRDIVWAYQYTHTTEHRLYGIIKTGTTVVYSVHYYLRNGKKGAISVNKEAEAQEILEFFVQTQPHIIVGYSEQLNSICQQNFSELVRFSDERAIPQYESEYHEDENAWEREASEGALPYKTE